MKKGGSAADFGGHGATVRRHGDARRPATSACTPDALQCLSAGDCLAKMKESKILAVGGGWPGIAPAIKDGWASRSSMSRSPR